MDQVAESAGLWLLLVVALYANVFLHEIGHYTVARVLHLNITSAAVFSGPPVGRFRLRGIDYRFGCLPFEGGIGLSSVTVGWQLAAVVAAGPMVNMLILAAAWIDGGLAGIPVALAALVSLGSALWPTEGSDGWFLWRMARGHDICPFDDEQEA